MGNTTHFTLSYLLSMNAMTCLGARMLTFLRFSFFISHDSLPLSAPVNGCSKSQIRFALNIYIRRFVHMYRQYVTPLNSRETQ